MATFPGRSWPPRSSSPGPVDRTPWSSARSLAGSGCHPPRCTAISLIAMRSLARSPGSPAVISLAGCWTRWNACTRPTRAPGRSWRSGRSGAGTSGLPQDEPNLLATAFLPIMPSAEAIEDPSPWHILAGALDDLVATGAMPPERRVGAETIAWSAVHGFAVLRAGHAFEASGEPAPDPEGVLDAIARSLELVQAPGRRHPPG